MCVNLWPLTVPTGGQKNGACNLCNLHAHYTPQISGNTLTNTHKPRNYVPYNNFISCCVGESKRPHVVYRIVGKLAGIKFGDFSQNAVFLNLADSKFGDSVPQPMSRGRQI